MEEECVSSCGLVVTTHTIPSYSSVADSSPEQYVELAKYFR